MRWVVLLAVLHCAAAEFYETYSGNQISPQKYMQYQARNMVPYCAQEIRTCDEKELRRFDYSCNNLHSPITGTKMTPYRRLLPPVFGRNFDHRPSSSGAPLPNVRSVRTSIMTDGRAYSKKITSLLTNGLLMITSEVTSGHDTFNYVSLNPTCCITGEADPRCRPIYIPEDDIHLRYSDIRCMNHTKVITYQDLGCISSSLPLDRINLAPPMLELSPLYGMTENDLRRGREFNGGRLRSEQLNGREWPPSGAIYCRANQPPAETRCHDIPNPLMNVLMGVNVMNIWFYRSHNRIARQLEAINHCWDDEKILRAAREINIGFANQMWYYEMFPSLLGADLLLEEGVIYDTMDHVNDYNPKLDPKLSIEFAIVQRWFHYISDGRLKLYSRKGKLLGELPFVDLTLRTGILPNNRTIEGMTQGFFRQAAAESDNLIDPDYGERALGSLQRAADLASIDLMKNREAALAPYVSYREYCHLPVPKDFGDMLEWMDIDSVEAFKFRYEKVEDIDLLAGIIAEKTVPGGIVGPTLQCIYLEQLRSFRRSDRFWYENDQHPGAFTKEQLHQIRRMTMARMLCDNGDDVDAVQPNPFLLPGPNNEITDCKNIPTVSFQPWMDHSCGENGHKHVTPRRPAWGMGPTSKTSALQSGVKYGGGHNYKNSKVEVEHSANFDNRGTIDERYLTKENYGKRIQNKDPVNAGLENRGQYWDPKNVDQWFNEEH